MNILLSKIIAAAALTASAATTAQTIHLTGNDNWWAPNHCVTRERYTSIGWVQADVCSILAVSSQWGGSWVGGEELAVISITTSVKAWRYSEATKTWSRLRPKHVALSVSETTDGSRDRISFTCGWVNPCSQYGVQRAAGGIRREEIVFQDCNTYPWHARVTLTLDIPGAGKVFDGFSEYLPASGHDTAVVCSP